MTDANLFSVLRAGFPEDLDSTAIERVGAAPLYYTWRDIERATAMLACRVPPTASPIARRLLPKRIPQAKRC